MNCKSFEELTSAASLCLQNMGRSTSFIRIYLWAWGRFRKYLDENKIRELSEQVVMDYIEATYGQSEISTDTPSERSSPPVHLFGSV